MNVNERQDALNSKLKKKYNVYFDIEFPNLIVGNRFNDDNNFDDLGTELLKMDTCIAGIISTYLKRGVVRFSLLNQDKLYKERLSLCSQEILNSNEYIQVKQYKDKLMEMIYILQEIEKLNPEIVQY